MVRANLQMVPRAGSRHWEQSTSSFPSSSYTNNKHRPEIQPSLTHDHSLGGAEKTVKASKADWGLQFNRLGRHIQEFLSCDTGNVGRSVAPSGLTAMLIMESLRLDTSKILSCLRQKPVLRESHVPSYEKKKKAFVRHQTSEDARCVTRPRLPRDARRFHPNLLMKSLNGKDSRNHRVLAGPCARIGIVD